MSTQISTIFREIEIGIDENITSLLKGIEASGAVVSNRARDILNKIELSKFKQSFDLVVPSVEELGYPQGTQLRNIYKAGNERGLYLCPEEMGPKLREKYTDQLVHESLTIATELIKNSVGDSMLFSVEHSAHDGLWLDAYLISADSYFNAKDRFVFVLRK